jgi:dihydrofolate reductase
MTVSIVVAQGSNRVIGVSGGLPWHLPSDMRRFRELTMGHAVVMGRKTYESIPARFRPLPGRRNLVISSNASYEGAEVFATLAAAVEACEGKCFVIGGGQVYADAMEIAQRCYVTDIDHAPDGDTFFPQLAAEDWDCTEESEILSENGHSFVFRVYDRASAIRPDGGSERGSAAVHAGSRG